MFFHSSGFRSVLRALLRLLLLSAVALFYCVSAPAQVIGEIFASDASIRGSVLLASTGAQVMSGSSVGAGTSPAVLKLERGGEVRICSRTSLTVNASQNGRDLMFSVGTGSMEAHYALAASADSIITPDFRLLLAGPGTFHIAILADAQGNTSIRTLPNDTASVIVSELLGDGTYQVRPGEEVVFHGGKVANPDHLVPPECGCPPPRNDIALAAPPPEAAAPAPPAKVAEAAPDVHVEVEAPFVFRATDPIPAPVYAVARLGLGLQTPHWNLDVALPPAPAPTPARVVRTAAAPSARPAPKRGFFGHLKAFFASVFR